jgi:hypothetical protein
VHSDGATPRAAISSSRTSRAATAVDEPGLPLLITSSPSVNDASFENMVMLPLLIFQH